MVDTTIQPETTGDAPDNDQEVRMTPYTLLPIHDPVPMALVNREPYGGEWNEFIFLACEIYLRLGLFTESVSSPQPQQHPQPPGCGLAIGNQ